MEQFLTGVERVLDTPSALEHFCDFERRVDVLGNPTHPPQTYADRRRNAGTGWDHRKGGMEDCVHGNGGAGGSGLAEPWKEQIERVWKVAGSRRRGDCEIPGPELPSKPKRYPDHCCDRHYTAVEGKCSRAGLQIWGVGGSSNNFRRPGPSFLEEQPDSEDPRPPTHHPLPSTGKPEEQPNPPLPFPLPKYLQPRSRLIIRILR